MRVGEPSNVVSSFVNVLPHGRETSVVIVGPFPIPFETAVVCCMPGLLLDCAELVVGGPDGGPELMSVIDAVCRVTERPVRDDNEVVD